MKWHLIHCTDGEFYIPEDQILGAKARGLLLETYSQEGVRVLVADRDHTAFLDAGLRIETWEAVKRLQKQPPPAPLEPESEFIFETTQATIKVMGSRCQVSTGGQILIYRQEELAFILQPDGSRMKTKHFKGEELFYGEKQETKTTD